MAKQANQHAMFVNWYLSRRLRKESSSVSNVEIDTSHDFHKHLFMVATNGIQPTEQLMKTFEEILQGVPQSVRQNPNTGKSSIQQTVVIQVYPYNEDTEDYEAQVWTTTFQLTKDVIQIVNGKTKSDKPRVNVHLICNCFRISEWLARDVLYPPHHQTINKIERLLVDNRGISVEEVKIDQKLIRSDKYATPRLEEPESSKPAFGNPSSFRYRWNGLSAEDCPF